MQFLEFGRTLGLNSTRLNRMVGNMYNRAAEDNTLSLKKSGLPAVSHPGHELVTSGRARGDSGFKRIREESRRGSDDIDQGQAR